MRLRIIVVPGGAKTVLRIAGELLSDGLAEVERELHRCSWPVQIDLSEVRSVDEAGLIYLRELRQRGIELGGASTYLTRRLDQEAATPSSRTGDDRTRPSSKVTSKGDGHGPQ